MNQFDVAIVGCGPTGATLANLLGLQGIRTLVIDREADIYPLPRAVHFDDEVMRVFQTVGIADDLANQVHINPGMRFVDENDEVLLDWPRPQTITEHGWHASYRLHQPDLERLLRKQLRTHPTISEKLNTEAVAIVEGEDNCTLSLRCRETGNVSEVTASYVVGCDGARSMVRQVIGEGMEDLGFHERWLVVDVLLKRPRPELGDFTLQFCNPDRPTTYCRSPANRRRWEITVLENETNEEVQNSDWIWGILSRWITTGDAELERSAVYTFRSAMAQCWRRGRLLIAGDAAHLTPPFMGQGMCAGIRDAANLGWKLATVTKQANADLLETYQQERAPHARSYIETAMRLGGLINSLNREDALALAASGNEMRSIAPSLGTSIVADTDNVSGNPFAQLTLSDGRRLDDVVGYQPAILTRLPIEKQSHLHSICGEEHPEIDAALSQIGETAILLRPDRYVMAVGEPEHLTARWDEVV